MLETDTAVVDLAKEVGKLSVGNNDTYNLPIVYSKEEIDAIRQVRQELIDVHKIDPSRIGLKTLALTTIVCKLKVDEASKKYVTYLIAVEKCGVTNLRDDEVLNLSKSDLEKFLESYAICGRDEEGRSIMWVKSAKEAYPEELEEQVVKAGIMYHTAIHADNVSLQNGVTFVIDTSNKPALPAKNDKKLSKTWQSMPLRPQAILIAGASRAMRVVINSLIRVASLFTKQKVLDRIKFVSTDEAFESVPKESAPAYLGGGGGNHKDIVQWTLERIERFPVPNL